MKKQNRKPPKILLDSIKDTADEFRKSLGRVGWLSGERSSPMPERNTVVHLAHTLLCRGFAVYAEPTLKNKYSRIDLLASNSKYSFVFEVKTFGARDLSKVQDDVKKLRGFSPWAAKRKESTGTETYFWNKTEKWAVVLVQSHSGEGFTELWKKQVLDQDAFKEDLGKYERLQSPGRNKFSRFASFLRKRYATVGAYSVCEEIWEGAHSIDLLWAAFEK